MNHKASFIKICRVVFLIFLWSSKGIGAADNEAIEKGRYEKSLLSFSVLLNPDLPEAELDMMEVDREENTHPIQPEFCQIDNPEDDSGSDVCVLLTDSIPDEFMKLGLRLVQGERQESNYINYIFDLAQQALKDADQIENKRRFVIHRLQYCLALGYCEFESPLKDVDTRLNALYAAWENLFHLAFTPNAWVVGFGDLKADDYLPYAWGAFIPKANNLNDADLLARCLDDLENQGMEYNPTRAQLILSHLG